MTQPERYCPSCVAVVAFEQPPCPDGHEECPDLACTLCGTVLFTGVAPSRRGHDASHRAPHAA
ncbi:MAG: hypothetical protein GEV10_13720 [Streptosporangiales bacterium]|nr:hypothetical protein [Streptosporangiales bacterium]